MDRRISAWLENILKSIDEIIEFLLEKKTSFSIKKTWKQKKAVKRNIEIIGEAINRITNHKEANFQINNAQKIIGVRNRIAHEYNNISDELIWTMINRELPELRKEIQAIMENYQS